MGKKKSSGNVLLISDTQAPFHHIDAIDFLSAVADEIKPDHIVHVGDELDQHTLARSFSPHPNAPSAGDEFDQGKAWLDELERLFPRMYLCLSNHGARIYKKAQDVGIPDQWIKHTKDAYDKKHWEWSREWWLPWRHGNVCVYHGDRIKGSLKYAKMLGASVVCGHHHQEFGIQFHNSRAQIYFGMDVGCLVDEDAKALAYAKTAPLGQMLGCGSIVDSWPRLWAMETDENNRWTGRLV